MASTIYDVAHKAGVSISTVSRVLNNNPSVLDETRQKVLKVIAELEFKPNPIARGLVVKQTNLIELLFSWFGPKMDFRSHWYLEILNGVNEVVQENQFGLLVNTVAGDVGNAEIEQKVFRSAVDGILMVSPFLEEKEILRMMDRRVPIILVGHRPQDERIDFVDADNLGAAAQVADLFVELGHKKIACIAGPISVSGDAADRLKGFEKAIAHKGIPLAKGHVQEGQFNRESGFKAMEKLLMLPERPTAVFACDDAMAIGAWDAIEKAGLKVGKDIALVGFDDAPEASQPPYSLTTLKQDFRKLAMEATKLLITRIRNPNDWKPRHLLLPTPLIVRKSSGERV